MKPMPLRLSVVLVLALGVAAPALASPFGVPKGYKLEMAAIERCIGAQEKVFQRALKDPKLKAEILADAEEEGKDGYEKIDEVLKTAEKKAPRSVAAMRDAGCSMKEFLTVMFATVEAGMVSEILKANAKMPPELTTVPRENVELVQANMQKIEALQKRLKAAEQKLEE